MTDKVKPNLVEWKEEHQQAFDQLKKTLADAPILCNLEPDGHFFL